MTFLRSPWENRRASSTCDVKIMVMNIQDATSGLHFFELQAGETSVGHLSFWFRNSNKGNIIPPRWFLVLVFTCLMMTRTIWISFPFYDTLGQPNGISKTPKREGRRQGNYFHPSKNHQKISWNYSVLNADIGQLESWFSKIWLWQDYCPSSK